MTISIYQAAKTLCSLSDWKLSNLQIHKILYLSHMFFMAENKGEPLVDEEFEAWDYGPVLKNLYHAVKCYGNKPIRNIFYSSSILTKGSEFDILNQAAKHLAVKSAAFLVNLTHRQGGGWAKHYIPGARGIKIPNADILAEHRIIIKTE